MKKLLVALIAIPALVACGQQGTEEGKEEKKEGSTTEGKEEVVEKDTKTDDCCSTINVSDFKAVVEAGESVVLDVRTAEEIAEGKIAGATEFDFYSDDFQGNLETLDKNVPVAVYCRSGGRSGKAMEMMKEMGFTKVYNLDGGMTAWEGAGFDTVK